MLPKFNQLTQSIHDDGKGGYVIKNLPKEKEPSIEEQPQSTEPVVMRDEEVSLIKAVKDLMAENAELKEWLAKIESTDTVKSELLLKENEPIKKAIE